MKHKRILFVGDSALITTGYATVIRNLLNTLEFVAPENFYAQLGWYGAKRSRLLYFNYFGTLQQREDSVGLISFPKVLKVYKPDIVTIVNDPWFSDILSRTFPHLRDRFKLISYIAIDSEPIIRYYEQVIDNKLNLHSTTPTFTDPDHIVAFTKFAKDIILRDTNVDPDKLSVISHGVNIELFKPIPKKEVRKIVGDMIKSDLSKYYIYGFVGVNQIRKGIPFLIEAFRKVMNKYNSKRLNNPQKYSKEPLLILFAAHSSYSWTLSELIREFNLEQNVKVIDAGNIGFGLEDYILNYIYNVFDVLVAPSNREGFNLPVLESLSTGTPVLVTKFGPMWDWSKSVAIPIEVKNFTRAFHTNYKEAHVSVDDLFQKMWMCYKTDPKALNSKKYRAFAKTLSWTTIAKQWQQLFNNIPIVAEEKKNKPLFLTVE